MDNTRNNVEFFQNDATKHDNLRVWITRWNYIVAKLKDVGIVIPDKLLQANLLQGLKNYDVNWTDMLKFQLQAGQLEFKSLLTMITTRANEQAILGMTAVKQANATGKNKPGGSNSGSGQSSQSA